MIGWMTGWVWWFTWRTAVSLACMWTIQNVIHQEGYYIDFHVLLVAGVCAVVGIRVWMPSARETKDHYDRNKDK
jgi:hypothetical protein